MKHLNISLAQQVAISVIAGFIGQGDKRTPVRKLKPKPVRSVEESQRRMDAAAAKRIRKAEFHLWQYTRGIECQPIENHCGRYD